MTRQLTTLTLCLLLASCTTHKAEPARPAFDSSRNPDLLSPDLYPNGVQPEKEPVVRYGRYTLVSTQPDAGQRDLMAQIIDVTIPSSMNPSVKDAMQYVMSRSGYSLCPAEAGHVNILYTRPLPAAQYKLGPMTLRNTLQVLSGPAWQVKVDEVARQVCFVLRPGYQLPPTPRPKPVQQLYAKPAAPTPAAVAQLSSTEKSARWSRPSWSPRCQRRRRSQPAPLRPRSLNPPLCSPSRTGQGWPPLFSSRGFGTDQARWPPP
ncbi:PilL N-terminal domain-containing protein [Pseudomonas aeruginosa]|nr:PilL N-terminal domain-containing protein [Pseudomonas aeruginosa]